MQYIDNNYNMEIIYDVFTSLDSRLGYCPVWPGHIHHVGVSPDWLKEHKKEIREHPDCSDVKFHADNRLNYREFSFDSYYTENHTKKDKKNE